MSRDTIDKVVEKFVLELEAQLAEAQAQNAELRRQLFGSKAEKLSSQQQAQMAGRRLSAATAKRPGVLREAGMSALQVWQAVSEAQGRGRGDREIAIVFTDLVEFSEWALEAGDDRALDGQRHPRVPRLSNY